MLAVSVADDDSVQGTVQAVVTHRKQTVASVAQLVAQLTLNFATHFLFRDVP
jgi:hypothetical protein